MNHEHNGKLPRWHHTTSNDKVERIALRNARWRMLELLKQDMCWTPCLILSIAWQILTPREILKNNWRMNRILDEPPCRASMKNFCNKRMIKRSEGWKNNIDALQWLDEALRRDKVETWNSGRKELNHLKENKNKIYCMFILHQLNLMISNGFGILLILIGNEKGEI